MSTVRVCPECRGNKKIRGADYTYIDACPCCLGFGDIYFGEMYPPSVDYVKESRRQWYWTEGPGADRPEDNPYLKEKVEGSK